MSGVIASRAETPLEVPIVEAQQNYTTRAFSRTSARLIQDVKTQTDFVNEQLSDDQLLQSVIENPKRMEETGTQTHRGDFGKLQLTPFDTYDLYFVKDLVNNLSQDNEVL